MLNYAAVKHSIPYIVVGSLFTVTACAQTAGGINFSPQQVTEGREIYVQHCQVCHGTNLDNGQFGTPLKGFFFENKWGGLSLGELARFTYNEMPTGNGRSLRENQYMNVLAFVLSENGIEAGNGEELTFDFDALDSISLPDW